MFDKGGAACYKGDMISEKDKSVILTLAARYGATRVILFGSSADPERDASDIDLAAEGIRPGDFFPFYSELLFGLSKPVDLIDLSIDSSVFPPCSKTRGGPVWLNAGGVQMKKHKTVEISEKQLEDLIRQGPDLIEEGLQYIDHQRATDRSPCRNYFTAYPYDNEQKWMGFPVREEEDFDQVMTLFKASVKRFS